MYLSLTAHTLKTHLICVQTGVNVCLPANINSNSCCVKMRKMLNWWFIHTIMRLGWWRQDAVLGQLISKFTYSKQKIYLKHSWFICIWFIYHKTLDYKYDESFILHYKIPESILTTFFFGKDNFFPSLIVLKLFGMVCLKLPSTLKWLIAKIEY